jgi:CheY-like chemotaxis protein
MSRFLRILLIDDDIDDQFFFTEAVRSIDAEFICHTSNTVENGFEYLETEPKPDLIFLDLNMPGMNGFDFLKSIRQRDEFYDLPVVIYSTSSRIKDIDDARLYRAQAFLTKPSDLNSLKIKLLTAFGYNYKELDFMPVID